MSHIECGRSQNKPSDSKIQSFLEPNQSKLDESKLHSTSRETMTKLHITRFTPNIRYTQTLDSGNISTKEEHTDDHKSGVLKNSDKQTAKKIKIPQCSGRTPKLRLLNKESTTV